MLTTYLLTVLIFMAAKVVFMLCNAEDHPFDVSDVAGVVGHGLSLDLSTALYFLIVPFLLSLASLWVRVPRWLLLSYTMVMAVVLALAFVADTSLYSFWQFKLDASCLQYLETPTEAMASVSWGYIAVRLLALVLLVTLLFSVYRWPIGFLRAVAPLMSRLKAFAAGLAGLLLMAPVFIIGIRGGLDESTTNIGQAYYSPNQFLNHSAVNPVFSFLSSLGKSGNYIVSYDYFSDEECAWLTDGLFPRQSQTADTLLTTPRPNIVVVIMESCGGQFTEMGGHPEIMPRLNKLCREGVFFSECYANSWRTDKGVVSVLSGYPAFPVTSVMKIPEKSRKLPSLAGSLAAEGYSTAFYYGGDINFTNMRSYLMATGFQQVRWKADYSRDEQRSAQWGVCDELMFASLLSDIKAERSSRWMKTLLTLSSHEPWDVGTHELEDPVYNAFNYLDRCLGRFVDELRRLPIWDNLLLVVLPDHGYRYQGIGETTRLYNHVPMLWLGGAVDGPRRMDMLCNQSDLAATLLGQMGIDHQAFIFSRDVVSNTYCRPMAWHTSTDCLSLYDSTGWMAYNLDAGQFIAREGAHADSLLRVAKALLQLTSHDLRSR